MKRFKLLFAIAALCLVASSCGPSIVLNNTSHGERQILTSNLKMGTAKNVGDFYVALGVRISGRDTVLAILVTCNADSKQSIFDKGDKFRVGFTDGTELALENIFENMFEEDSGTRVTNTIRSDYGYLYSYGPFTDSFYIEPYSITRMVPEVSTYKETNSYAMYPISKPHAQILGEKTVSKIRIESKVADLDVNDHEKIKNVFGQLYDCIVPVVEQGIQTAF